MTPAIIQLQKKEEAKFLCSACGADRCCDCNAPAIPKAQQAIEAIKANPDKSDRAIAKEIGASPTTVGKAREELSTTGQLEDKPRVGLDGKVRKQPATKEASIDEPAAGKVVDLSRFCGGKQPAKAVTTKNGHAAVGMDFGSAINTALAVPADVEANADAASSAEKRKAGYAAMGDTPEPEPAKVVDLNERGSATDLPKRQRRNRVRKFLNTWIQASQTASIVLQGLRDLQAEYSEDWGQDQATIDELKPLLALDFVHAIQVAEEAERLAQPTWCRLRGVPPEGGAS